MPVRAARLLFQLPNDCRVYKKLAPANQWGWTEVLLNKANYILETIAWQNATPPQKGKQAAHKAKRPKPFVPDFMQGAGRGIDAESERHTVDDVKSILDLPRE